MPKGHWKCMGTLHLEKLYFWQSIYLRCWQKKWLSNLLYTLWPIDTTVQIETREQRKWSQSNIKMGKKEKKYLDLWDFILLSYSRQTPSNFLQKCHALWSSMTSRYVCWHSKSNIHENPPPLSSETIKFRCGHRRQIIRCFNCRDQCSDLM